MVFSMCDCGFVCRGGGAALIQLARFEWLRLQFVGEVEGKTATLVKEVFNSGSFVVSRMAAEHELEHGRRDKLLLKEFNISIYYL